MYRHELFFNKAIFCLTHLYGLFYVCTVQRSIYKDLVLLLQTNSYLKDGQLRAKVGNHHLQKGATKAHISSRQYWKLSDKINLNSETRESFFFRHFIDTDGKLKCGGKLSETPVKTIWKYFGWKVLFCSAGRSVFCQRWADTWREERGAKQWCSLPRSTSVQDRLSPATLLLRYALLQQLRQVDFHGAERGTPSRYCHHQLLPLGYHQVC